MKLGGFATTTSIDLDFAIYFHTLVERESLSQPAKMEFQITVFNHVIKLPYRLYCPTLVILQMTRIFY